MKYQTLSNAKAYQRFRALAASLRKRLKNGQYQHMLTVEGVELMKKLRLLYGRLHRVIGTRKLQKALATGALLLGLGLSSTQAQDFGPAQISPFGLAGNGDVLIAPVAVDMDDDGDVDLLCTAYESLQGGKVFYYENIGDATIPNYAARVESPFGMIAPASVTALTVGDLDSDGDLDILLGSYNDNGQGQDAVYYFENTGSSTTPAFGSPTIDPFGIEVLGDNMVPKLLDLDGDGDLDLLNTNYDGNTYEASLYYQENTGTTSIPLFTPAVEDPFGLPTDLPDVPLYDLADMDGDGDYDMILGNTDYLYVGDSYRAYLSYIENTGTPEVPAFAAAVAEPFGIQYPLESFLPLPTIADFDDDGDLDIMSFAYVYSSVPNAEVNVFVYFENESDPVSTTDLTPDLDWSVFPTLAKDQVNLQIPAETGQQYQLEVLTSTGQVVRSKRVVDANSELSLANLAKGNYWLRLRTTTGEQFAVKQIIKL